MKFENLNENYLKRIFKDEPEWFVSDRLKSLKLFNQAKEDSFRYGSTMKTDVSDIKISDYESKINLVLKNNDSRIIIKDFKKALTEDDELIRKFFMKEIKTRMELLHKAIVQEGLLIYIPKNVKVKEDITIDYEFLTNSFDYLLVIAEENSELNIIERLRSKEIFRSNVVEIYAGRNSKVNFYSIQDMDNNCINFSVKRSFAGKDSECNFYNFDFGSKLNYSDTYSELVEEGSCSKIKGIYFGNEKQHFNLASSTHHKSRNTNSDIFTRGILDDNSNIIYRGLVKIYENAENSNGYQKEDALILSENAKADSNLEINNHDVKCSHSSSISHLDKDKLFYLMSRGIDYKECTKIMTEGFLMEVLNKIDKEEIKEEIKQLIKSKIK